MVRFPGNTASHPLAAEPDGKTGDEFGTGRVKLAIKPPANREGMPEECLATRPWIFSGQSLSALSLSLNWACAFAHSEDDFRAREFILE
jgi:hypothetical protein